MPLVIALVSTLGSAVLYGLSFPPTRWRLLAWVAQVPFLLSLRRSRPGAALLLGWVFTVTVAYTTGDWFPRSVANYYQQPTALGVLFFFAVASLMAAPWVMAFAVAYQRVARAPAQIVPLLTAAAWVAQEMARSRGPTANPWATFGYSQVGVAALVQIADLTGVFGISFLLVAVNAAVAEICLTFAADAPARRAAMGGLTLAALAVAAAVGYGHFRLADAARPAAPATPLAIIQGNLDLGSQWRADFYGRNLDVYLNLTRTAVAQAHPALVLWPESAMTFFVDTEPTYQAAIGSVLRAANVQLLAGGPRETATEPRRYYNSAFLISPRGAILAAYDKLQLLPFAEYFPFTRVDFLRRRFERVREFSPGAPGPPLPTVAGRAGVLICNEAMFPQPAAARVAAGADYLVSPANDSWLGDAKFSEQAFDMAVLRAVEQRRFLVRTSTAGPSAIIDPFGRVVVRSAPFTRTWISGGVHRATTRTVYHRVGDFFGTLCAAVAVVATVRCGRRRSRPDA